MKKVFSQKKTKKRLIYKEDIELRLFNWGFLIWNYVEHFIRWVSLKFVCVSLVFFWVFVTKEKYFNFSYFVMFNLCSLWDVNCFVLEHLKSFSFFCMFFFFLIFLCKWLVWVNLQYAVNYLFHFMFYFFLSFYLSLIIYYYCFDLLAFWFFLFGIKFTEEKRENKSRQLLNFFWALNIATYWNGFWFVN